MPLSEQLKALVQSHRDGDDEHFYSVALQLAALEARKGNAKLAEEIKRLVDASRMRPQANKAVALHQPRGELAQVLAASYPAQRLADLVADGALSLQLQRVVREQRHLARLTTHGLSPRRKLLLVGPPGTGKTFTASALAGELSLPLFQIRFDALITKFMGESAARLRQVFDAMTATRGVYFFDEFDAIGSHRGQPGDVGEARRILNSFLQMLEHDQSHSLILAATNHPDMLDPALLRRFDDVLQYHLPDDEQAESLIRARLAGRLPRRFNFTSLRPSSAGLSFAELAKAADDALKESLIQEESTTVKAQLLERMLRERQAMRSAWAKLPTKS